MPRRGALRSRVAALSGQRARGADRRHRSRSPRAKPSRWSARRAAARRRSSTSCRASTSRRAGRLFIDGHDVSTLQRASLRAQIAMVSQDVLLFNDTIAANIAYGAMADASREAIERAAAAAHALDFIRAAAAGLRHAGRRARRPPVGRPAPADRDRARAAQERAAADPRRGDVGARFGIRAAGAGRARGTDARPHDDRHRAPPVDDRARRPHHRARARHGSSKQERIVSCCSATRSTRACTVRRLLDTTIARPGADTNELPSLPTSSAVRLCDFHDTRVGDPQWPKATTPHAGFRRMALDRGQPPVQLAAVGRGGPGAPHRRRRRRDCRQQTRDRRLQPESQRRDRAARRDAARTHRGRGAASRRVAQLRDCRRDDRPAVDSCAENIPHGSRVDPQRRHRRTARIVARSSRAVASATQRPRALPRHAARRSGGGPRVLARLPAVQDVQRRGSESLPETALERS